MSSLPAARFRLPASRRIKRRGDFAALRNEGRRLAIGCMTANWQVLGPGGNSVLGVITSRRIGCAVARNRARRLLREAFRQNQHRLESPVKIVLVARNSIVGKPFCEVEKDYLAFLGKAGLLNSLLKAGQT